MTYYGFPGLRVEYRYKYAASVRQDSNIYFRTRAKALLKAIREETPYTLADLRSKSRKPPLPFIRAVVANSLYIPYFVSLPMIADWMKKDHTTIFFYIDKLIPSVAHDPEFIKLNDKIRRYLSS